MSGLSSSAQKLTMAQIYVLRRMASGTVYDISGNFRRAKNGVRLWGILMM